jgi:hypothetical protein
MKRFIPTGAVLLPLLFFTASDSSKNPGANGFGGEKSMSLYAGIEHVTALSNTEVGRSK